MAVHTRKDWSDFKKKKGIPDGAVKGVDFGPALDKCAKVVNDGKKPDEQLKAINEFRKVFDRYRKELDKDLLKKAGSFLDEVKDELDKTEKEIFANAPKGGKGSVVNLDEGDDTIDKASSSVSKDRKHGADKSLRRMGDDDSEDDDKSHDKEVGKKDADFSKASKEPIILLAHGSPIGKPGSGKVRASHFADKKPDDIVSFLTKSLEKTYYGQVYLDGCFTAAGNTPMNFAKKVYDGLVKKGYYYLQVKGNLGAAITVDGKEFVIPAELDDKYEALKKEKTKLEADIKKEGKQYDDARTKLINDLKAVVGNRKMSDLPPAEKQKGEKLNSAVESVNKLEKENKKIIGWKERLKAVNEMLEKELKIEALTGTFGPERLPPK